MRVFVTGATGFIGSAIVPELINAGHQVLGLARSDAGAKALAAAGAQVHRGDLEDLDSLRSGAAPVGWRDPLRLQPRLLEIRGQLRGGPARHRGARLRARRLRPPADRHLRDRAASRRAASRPKKIAPASSSARIPARLGRDRRFAGGARRARVGGAPSAGPRPSQAGPRHLPDRSSSRERVSRRTSATGATAGPRCIGSMPRISTGWRWRRDAREPGITRSREEGVPLRDIAEAIGRRLNVPVVSKSPEEAAEHFGWLAMIRCVSTCAASSARTQERLGWHPTGLPGLISDLEPLGTPN